MRFLENHYQSTQIDSSMLKITHHYYLLQFLSIQCNLKFWPYFLFVTRPSVLLAKSQVFIVRFNPFSVRPFNDFGLELAHILQDLVGKFNLIVKNLNIHVVEVGNPL